MFTLSACFSFQMMYFLHSCFMLPIFLQKKHLILFGVVFLKSLLETDYNIFSWEHQELSARILRWPSAVQQQTWVQFLYMSPKQLSKYQNYLASCWEALHHSNCQTRIVRLSHVILGIALAFSWCVVVHCHLSVPHIFGFSLVSYMNQLVVFHRKADVDLSFVVSCIPIVN